MFYMIQQVCIEDYSISKDWYKTLNLNQRLFLKSECKTITGIEFSDAISIFGFFKLIDILYNKLKIEGIL